MRIPTKEVLQWHPAFYAGIQIELLEEAEHLEFENEHQLGMKPKEIDAVVIKKNSKIKIRKNIGQIFRTYNIFEYKSPTDYLSVDDFYQVYGYACFYKSQSLKQNAIPAEEITLTFVCKNPPIKFLEHLKNIRKYEIQQVEKGIYYILGDFFPMQLIITAKLSEDHNFWLKNLTDDLQNTATAEKMLQEYKKHREDKLYESVMDLLIRANEEIFEEAKGHMCKALMELMKDEFDAAVNEAVNEAVNAAVNEAVNEAVNAAVNEAVKEQEKLNQRFLESRLEPIRKKLAKGKTLEVIAEELEEELATIKYLYEQYLEGEAK